MKEVHRGEKRLLRSPLIISVLNGKSIQKKHFFFRMLFFAFLSQEVRKKLGQKLLVSDLLIKPVQRIMRYQLLLKEILRSTIRMGDEPRAISGALDVMIEVPRQANDMMNVGRIKDLPTNVHQLGELKLQDMLCVSEPIGKDARDAKELEKKLKERRVFLFQQAMVFCEEIPAKDKYSSPNYIYKCDLKVCHLTSLKGRKIHPSQFSFFAD